MFFTQLNSSYRARKPVIGFGTSPKQCFTIEIWPPPAHFLAVQLFNKAHPLRMNKIKIILSRRTEDIDLLFYQIIDFIHSVTDLQGKFTTQNKHCVEWEHTHRLAISNSWAVASFLYCCLTLSGKHWNIITSLFWCCSEIYKQYF